MTETANVETSANHLKVTVLICLRKRSGAFMNMLDLQHDLVFSRVTRVLWIICYVNGPTNYTHKQIKKMCYTWMPMTKKSLLVCHLNWWNICAPASLQDLIHVHLWHLCCSLDQQYCSLDQ